MFRALPVVSTSAPMPVAVIGSERTGCWVVPVDPVVPLACWLRLPRVPASTAAVRLVVRVAAAWPPGPPCPVWPPGPAWPDRAADGGVELLHLRSDRLVRHQHGQGQANGDGQHRYDCCGADLVSEGIAYASGKDAHVTPRTQVPARGAGFASTLAGHPVRESGHTCAWPVKGVAAGAGRRKARSF